MILRLLAVVPVLAALLGQEGQITFSDDARHHLDHAEQSIGEAQILARLDIGRLSGDERDGVRRLLSVCPHADLVLVICILYAGNKISSPDG